MKIIPVDYRKDEATTGDVTHYFQIVQLVIGRGQRKLRDSEIETFIRDNTTVEMNACPFGFKVEVANPEECGLVAVVLRVIASFHDIKKSRFRSEGSEVFFDEEILIPIDVTGMFGVGVADTAFKSNGYHQEYLIARDNAR